MYRKSQNVLDTFDDLTMQRDIIIKRKARFCHIYICIYLHIPQNLQLLAKGYCILAKETKTFEPKTSQFIYIHAILCNVVFPTGAFVKGKHFSGSYKKSVFEGCFYNIIIVKDLISK